MIGASRSRDGQRVSRRMRATHAPYSSIECQRDHREIEEPEPNAVSSRHFQYLPRRRNFDDTANRVRARIARKVSSSESRTVSELR